MGRRYLLYASERYALAILRPLEQAIRARGDEAAWFFDGPGAGDLRPDERRLDDIREVRRFNPVASFAPGNHIPHLVPGLKVMVFHGFDAGKPRHIYVRGYFDLYCTTGPRDTERFRVLAEQLGHFLVRETGWPKLDPYIDFASRPRGERPIVLYHSTFSPSWSAAEILYPQVRELARGGRWHFIVSFHPKMKAETVAKFRALEGPHLEFSDCDNILDLFPAADVMVSDTSSALSEFLLWHKPVVTFRNQNPGPQLIDIDDPGRLGSAIEQALGRPPDLMRAIESYAAAIHPYRDGRSSERVLAAVDELVTAGARAPRPKPRNLWRRFKMRWRLGYWGR